MSLLLALAAVALAATAGVRLCATSGATTHAPARLVKGGPRYFENPLIQWRRGLIDPPLYRSAHAPRRWRR